MDLNSFLDSIVSYIGQVHPVVAAGLAVLVFWLRTKGWLQIKLPSLPSKPADPSNPAPTPDVPDPLANHPLVKRLLDKVLSVFGARVIDNGEDHDDVYIEILNRLKALEKPTVKS